MFIFHQGQRGAGQSGPVSMVAMRVIVLALVFGLATFSVVGAVLGPVGGDEAGGFDLGVPAIAIAAGLAVVALVVPFVVRPLLAHRVAGRRKEAEVEIADGKVPAELASATIVAAALAEGPGMLGAVLLLISGDLAYLVPAGAGVVGILAMLPTRAWMTGAVERA